MLFEKILKKIYAFAAQTAKQTKRRPDKMQNTGQKADKRIKGIPADRGEDAQITDRAQKQGCADAHLHDSATGADAPEEECGGGAQPEQQIQQTAPDRAGDAAAHTAQPVIEQSDADAKCRPAQQSGQLAGNGNAHPPSRRAKKPPEARFSS